MSKKALIAMSGGVDSSVAAFLTMNMGYRCEGAIMKLCDSTSAGNVEDARLICRNLGIEFHVFDFKKEFYDKVIGKFVSDYESGMTPNPCVVCNKYLKFGEFMKCSADLGMDFMVTGHYARIEKSGDRYLLKKAADISKDQTYFLYSLTQAQLSRILFPLGDYTKPEIRNIAEEQGFITAKKSDSQDICFVENGNYAQVIRDYTGRDYPPGDFVSASGRVLGSHSGIINYTVGQRKGLGCAFGERLYVCDKLVDENRVVLGRNEDLFSSALDAVDFNWIACEAPMSDIRVNAKIRYTTHESEATVAVTGKDTVHIEFAEPQRAIARGQAVVLYDGDVVVGGGTIV